MVTFAEKFEKVFEYAAEQGIEAGFDNVMGLTYLNSMVDVITPNQKLRDVLHGFIESIIKDAMNVEFKEENEEYMKDFV